MEHQPAASIFLALQESALGHAMRSSPALYPAVEILHIIGFVVLVGSILALDLRLLGLGRAIAIPPMAQLLLPLSRAGFLLAIAHSGPWRHVESWHDEASGGAKATALLSLVLWLGAICAGRLIAYF